MEVHAEKCFERYCKLEKKHVSTLMHRRPPNTSGELFAVCAQIVLKCFWQEANDQIYPGQFIL